MNDYASLDELLDAAGDHSIHIECSRDVSATLLEAVRARARNRRCAFLVETDRGYDRETVRSYLALFARIAGGSITPDEAIAHFGLKDVARTKMIELTHEQLMLANFARLSLFEPEVCFCERPIADLGPEARHLVLTWIAERTEAGCTFYTTLEPLREALLLPGTAFWVEDGRFIAAERDDDDDASNADEPTFSGDEVRVCKIPAKADTSTLLFDPREIDFIESMNKANYVSARGTLYPTPLTMDELENQLVRFGFFRCHRSYIVNVQKVAKVERYTRNSFNLTLSDAVHSSIPLAKGRAEEMRERYNW